MNQSLLGSCFGFSQSKVFQWFTYLLPALEASLRSLGLCPDFGMNYSHQDNGETHLIGDVIERSIPRKTCYKAQKEDFSGKSHMHAEQNFAICNPIGRILFLSYFFTDSTHDKTIFDELNVDVTNIPFLLDLGFQGAGEQGSTIISFKKTKGGELSVVKKQLNQAMSSVRVKVEHVFSALKSLKKP